MKTTPTVLKSDGESEWVEITGYAAEVVAPVYIEWTGDGRNRRQAEPTAEQAMQIAKNAAEAAKAAKDAEVSALAALAGIDPVTQKILEHSIKGWVLKQNLLGDYRMDGPGRFDGSFCVTRKAATEAMERGVSLS